MTKLKSLRRSFYITGLIIGSIYIWMQNIPYALAQEPSLGQDHGKKDWFYTIRPKDTLWGLCQKYSNDFNCWQKVVKYNRIRDPKYLPTGTRIRIPKKWLTAWDTTAKAVAVEGVVNKTSSMANTLTPLNVGDQLSGKDQVRSELGTATIEFSDGSQLFLNKFTHISLDTLQFNPEKNVSKTRIYVRQGRTLNTVSEHKSIDSSYEVATPAAVAAVRGTQYRVVVSEDSPQSMTTEVLKGQVEIIHGSEKILLEKGTALKVTEGKNLSQPVRMLPRPQVDFNNAKIVGYPHVFTWATIEGATDYRVSVFNKKHLIKDWLTKTPEASLEDLSAGEYLVSINAIDNIGFEGRARQFKLNVQSIEE